MKKQILALLSSLVITTTAALAHGGVEIGPNGGRILEFSKNETMHGEVSVKDGKFRIAVLDKDMKPVKLEAQTLTASGGPSAKTAKLDVTKDGDAFVIPTVKKNEWLIVQFKLDGKAKAITARMQYDTTVCGDCKNEEWLCKCAAAKAKK